jgi:predicted GTPase
MTLFLVLMNILSSHRHHLEHSFRSDSEIAMLEADVIGVVHDVSNTWARDRLDPKVLRLLHLYPMKHSFLILNKVCLYHAHLPLRLLMLYQILKLYGIV